MKASKFTQLVGVLSIGALALGGCKSKEEAPAAGTEAGAKGEGSSCGADGKPAEGGAKGDQKGCGK